MGKGSSGTKTTYTSSPEQRQIYSALLPMIQGMAARGTSQTANMNYGAPAAPTMPGFNTVAAPTMSQFNPVSAPNTSYFNTVNAPNMPSMTGVLSGVPQYNIPNVSSMMPSQDWYNSLSPDVMAGVWAPYQQASKGMLEQLGGIGQLGSARGGATGAAGAALGQFGADAANKVGLQAWQMTQPAMQQGWQAQLAQNMGGYQNQLTESGTNYGNEIARQQADYQQSLIGNQTNYNADVTRQMADYQQAIGANQVNYGNEASRQQSDYQQSLISNQTNYANEIARQQADYGMAQQAWGMPFGMTGMMPSTYSQGITTQPKSTNWMGMLGGAAGGGLMGSQMSGGYGQTANTGLGGIMGALGGK